MKLHDWLLLLAIIIAPHMSGEEAFFAVLAVFAWMFAIYLLRGLEWLEARYGDQSAQHPSRK